MRRVDREGEKKRGSRETNFKLRTKGEEKGEGRNRKSPKNLSQQEGLKENRLRIKEGGRERGERR